MNNLAKMLENADSILDLLNRGDKVSELVSNIREINNYIETLTDARDGVGYLLINIRAPFVSARPVRIETDTINILITEAEGRLDVATEELRVALGLPKEETEKPEVSEGVEGEAAINE